MKKVMKVLAIVVAAITIITATGLMVFADEPRNKYENETVVGETIDINGKALEVSGKVVFKDCKITVSNVTNGNALLGSPINLTLINTTLVFDGCKGLLCAAGEINITEASNFEVKNGLGNQAYNAGVIYNVTGKSILNMHDNNGYALNYNSDGGYKMFVNDSTVKLNNNAWYGTNEGDWVVENNSLIEASNNGPANYYSYGVRFDNLTLTDSRLVAENNGSFGLKIYKSLNATNSEIKVSGSNLENFATSGNTYLAGNTNLVNTKANFGVLIYVKDSNNANLSNSNITYDENSIVTARCTDSKDEGIANRNYTAYHNPEPVLVSNIITKEPTYTEAGERTITYMCPACKDTFQVIEPIPMLQDTVEIEDNTPLGGLSVNTENTTDKVINSGKVEINNETPLSNIANTADNSNIFTFISTSIVGVTAAVFVNKKKKECK